MKEIKKEVFLKNSLRESIGEMLKAKYREEVRRGTKKPNFISFFKEKANKWLMQEEEVLIEC